MHLPAMVNLVLEQMRQQAQTAVMLGCVTVDGHDFTEVCVTHLLAVGNQPAVYQGLLAFEFSGR
ncbi:hypothetical protein D3C84_1276460 [compost metagenome]